MYLLQTVQYFKEDDPVGALIFLIGLGAFILIVLIVNLVRKGVGGAMGSGRSRSTLAPRKFSGFTLYRLASSYGLNRDQAKVLEYVLRNDEVTDPARVLSSPNLLDRHFKRAYEQIERNSESEEDMQRKFALLFSVRNIIESTGSPKGNITSTTQVAENMSAVITTGRDSYPVRVVSSKGMNLLVECPRNALGTPIRLPKGTRVSLSFFTKSSKGYSFDSHVAGMSDTHDGPVIQLAHSNRAKALTQRRFRRKRTTMSCYFSFVRVEEVKNGRKKEKKMVVDRNRFKGSVTDISIGGCAIMTSAVVNAGGRLKIEFTQTGITAAALGQVLRTNRSGTIGTVVHVKFLKVPRRTMNMINAMVFEYNNEE
ncbi:MAG: PilZ domain-containing protein [Treponema sp.]|jgi:c-di-GMP-binding flagellar brake protein YcgR|nr:PilZ domain-containing protein [Treponema sp.]